MNQRSRWGILAGIIISLLAILLLGVLVDWQGVIIAWRDARAWVILPAAICVLIAMFARSMGWRSLMGNTPPLGKTFWDVQISYLLNNLLPFRLGDVARAVLVSRGTETQPAKVTGGEALSAVAVERVFDLIFAFAFFVAILPMIAGASWASRSLGFTLAAAIGGFLFFLLLGSMRASIMRWAEAFIQRVPMLRPLLSPLESFLVGLAAARALRRSLPAFLWMGLGWTCWILEYWAVLEGFQPGSGIWKAMLALVGGMAAVSVPAAPGSLGVYEGAVSAFLSIGGIALASATAFAIALHVLNIILLSVLGAVGLAVEGVTLTSIWRHVQSRTPDATL
jgi:glycosyltransferase 2 family protein